MHLRESLPAKRCVACSSFFSCDHQGDRVILMTRLGPGLTSGSKMHSARDAAARAKSFVLTQAIAEPSMISDDGRSDHGKSSVGKPWQVMHSLCRTRLCVFQGNEGPPAAKLGNLLRTLDGMGLAEETGDLATVVERDLADTER